MAETPEGASAFARYYMDVLSAALQNADAARVKALSDVGCGGCQNLIDAIQAESASGQKIRQASFNVIFAESPQVQRGQVIVDLRYERLAGALLDATTSQVIAEIAPEPALDAQMRLRSTRDGWVVLGFRSVSGG